MKQKRAEIAWQIAADIEAKHSDHAATLRAWYPRLFTIHQLRLARLHLEMRRRVDAGEPEEDVKASVPGDENAIDALYRLSGRHDVLSALRFYNYDYETIDRLIRDFES